MSRLHVAPSVAAAPGVSRSLLAAIQRPLGTAPGVRRLFPLVHALRAA